MCVYFYLISLLLLLPEGAPELERPPPCHQAAPTLPPSILGRQALQTGAKVDAPFILDCGVDPKCTDRVSWFLRTC